MSQLWPFIITGIATGALYGLAAMGLVLTYKTSGLFNFGHGAVSAMAAFLFYTLHSQQGLPWPVAALRYQVARPCASSMSSGKTADSVAPRGPGATVIS